MDALRFLVGGILPYVAAGVFVSAMVHRIYTWKELPAPAMTLFPSAPTPGANRINTLMEATLFKSLFKGDRLLWGFAWVFHVVLALVFVGHLRVFGVLRPARLAGQPGREGTAQDCPRHPGAPGRQAGVPGIRLQQHLEAVAVVVGAKVVQPGELGRRRVQIRRGPDGLILAHRLHHTS